MLYNLTTIRKKLRLILVTSTDELVQGASTDSSNYRKMPTGISYQVPYDLDPLFLHEHCSATQQKYVVAIL